MVGSQCSVQYHYIITYSEKVESLRFNTISGYLFIVCQVKYFDIRDHDLDTFVMRCFYHSLNLSVSLSSAIIEAVNNVA